MSKPRFEPIVRRIASESILASVFSLLKSIPWREYSLEVVIREVGKARKPDQNALMWAGPLRDIERQAWANGRQYSAEVWHEYFKQQHLPEANDPRLDELVKKPETYKKWDFLPSGERVCVGSTTDLTVLGFSVYLTALQAEASQMGVLLHASPNEVPA